MKDVKATEEDSDDSDDSGSDSSETEEASEEVAAPSKKRKADAEEAAPAKKAKNENKGPAGSKNLFVGGLSWNIDDDWLYREFAEYGELTGARVISDRETGKSKGFGYVEFANADDAAKALAAKHQSEIDGRTINVDFATPRDESAPKQKREERAKQYGDSQNPASDTLFVGNVAWEVDENMLSEAFGAHGTVVHVRLPTDR